MNERIRELARKAQVGSAEFGNGINYFVSTEETFNKFAELIVRECAEICLEMSAKCAGLPGDGALAKDCAYWIKKDFGVEL